MCCAIICLFKFSTSYHSFVTPQHAQHAQRDIVLPFLSVCPASAGYPIWEFADYLPEPEPSRVHHVVVLYPNDGTSSNFFHELIGASLLVFAAQTAAFTKFQVNLTEYTEWEKFAIFYRNRRLSRKQYEIDRPMGYCFTILQIFYR